ncbi:MAG: hypothetical protein KGJ07_02100 [Patescibacteria group bacterium]|nr:hypothetical protein [Patescibacteria group bacterium]
MDFHKKKFNTLAQYFSWMYGGNTGIFFVLGSANYKQVGTSILNVIEQPSVLAYLSKPTWDGVTLADLITNFPPHPITITSHISHMEPLQFQQFTGARIRYKLKDLDTFDTQAFLTACKNTDGSGVEDIFAKHTEYMYIEGRDPGANFPDQELLEKGNNIADSTYISPAAMQAGLLKNLGKTSAYIDSFSWEKLGELRQNAITNGLEGSVDGTSTYDFAQKIVELAGEGLSQEEQKYLAYPEFVLKTRQNGADRAIAFVEKQSGLLEKRLQELVKSRVIII